MEVVVAVVGDVADEENQEIIESQIRKSKTVKLNRGERRKEKINFQ
jgi:hypothetical protein